MLFKRLSLQIYSWRYHQWYNNHFRPVLRVVMCTHWDRKKWLPFCRQHKIYCDSNSNEADNESTFIVRKDLAPNKRNPSPGPIVTQFIDSYTRPQAWMGCNTLSSGDALTHWRRDKMVANFLVDIFKCIFLTEIFLIWITISLNFIPKDPINNITILAQIMVWRESGGKSLNDEPRMVRTDAYKRHSASMS